ncbi:MarR family transcriptional regulator [Sporolactobacillus sp. THM7-4]|nr:MarR family transcriptional regulator [Sporolactobacillus sp. THM7-4]
MELYSVNSLSSKDKKMGQNLWTQLSYAYHNQLRLSGQFLKQWNLSITQYEVIAQIGANQRLSQKELAGRLSVTKGNMTQLLHKMEESGYIKREKEWKTKYLSLTEKGDQLYKDVVPRQKSFQFSLFQSLSKKERKQFLKLLKKLNEGG